VAKRREHELLEGAGRGSLPANEQGPKRLSAAIEVYLAAKRMRCSPRTIELEGERLSLVKKHFGDVLLAAITATMIAEFQRTRHEAGIANRTINMDVGVLSRVLKSCGRWRALAEHVRNLPERQHPVGRALTADEQTRLFAAAASNQEWEHVYCAAIVAANTLQRSPEMTQRRSLRVDHPDFPLMPRASRDAHETALLHLPSVVCAGPPRRPSPARVFGVGLPDRAARADASLVASA
jgi:hypothetical protein